MTERTRSRRKMGFLRRVVGVSLRDRLRSSVIREELGVEPLLICVERSQLRWFGHLVRMPPGRLLREVFQACPAGRRPRGRPRTRWRDYISNLAWEHLGIPQSELVNVAREREVWGPLLELLPPRPDPGQADEDGWTKRHMKVQVQELLFFIYPRCSRKRCVFSLRRKMCRLSAILMSIGSLFHHLGVRTV